MNLVLIIFLHTIIISSNAYSSTIQTGELKNNGSRFHRSLNTSEKKDIQHFRDLRLEIALIKEAKGVKLSEFEKESLKGYKFIPELLTWLKKLKADQNAVLYDFEDESKIESVLGFFKLFDVYNYLKNRGTNYGGMFIPLDGRLSRELSHLVLDLTLADTKKISRVYQKVFAQENEESEVNRRNLNSFVTLDALANLSFRKNIWANSQTSSKQSNQNLLNRSSVNLEDLSSLDEFNEKEFGIRVFDRIDLSTLVKDIEKINNASHGSLFDASYTKRRIQRDSRSKVKKFFDSHINDTNYGESQLFPGKTGLSRGHLVHIDPNLNKELYKHLRIVEKEIEGENEPTLNISNEAVKYILRKYNLISRKYRDEDIFIEIIDPQSRNTHQIAVVSLKIRLNKEEKWKKVYVFKVDTISDYSIVSGLAAVRTFFKDYGINATYLPRLKFDENVFELDIDNKPFNITVLHFGEGMPLAEFESYVTDVEEDNFLTKTLPAFSAAARTFAAFHKKYLIPGSLSFKQPGITLSHPDGHGQNILVKLSEDSDTNKSQVSWIDLDYWGYSTAPELISSIPSYLKRKEYYYNFISLKINAKNKRSQEKLSHVQKIKVKSGIYTRPIDEKKDENYPYDPIGNSICYLFKYLSTNGERKEIDPFYLIENKENMRRRRIVKEFFNSYLSAKDNKGKSIFSKEERNILLARFKDGGFVGTSGGLKSNENGFITQLWKFAFPNEIDEPRLD